tara:strand:+ start:983 stop:1498 length:516 start_codon:yes stop_codon:yes gene_type:complete
MKVGICGKMASGKTTLAKGFEEEGYQIISLADEVKRVGRELFNMTGKDRPLLQKIGMKMREIRPSVWLDALMKQAENYPNVVCDDVRFINEAKTLKENGWYLIKIEIDENLQRNRLMMTYPDHWDKHWNNRHDSSEAEVDEIPHEIFDLVLTAEDSKSLFNLCRPSIKQHE